MTRVELLEAAKPILFSTEMVKAIQDGRKTVTRRIIKSLPESAHCLLDVDTETNSFEFMCGKSANGMCVDFGVNVRPPFRIGDILYVRETWAKSKIKKPNINSIPSDFKQVIYYYRANGELVNSDNSKFKWQPSIHMPKEAARIFLRVTNIKVEHLQDILTEGIDETFREGVYQDSGFNDWFTFGDGCHNSSPSDCFKRLWNSAVKKPDLDKYGWTANPWIWVIEFERIKVD